MRPAALTWSFPLGLHTGFHLRTLSCKVFVEVLYFPLLINPTHISGVTDMESLMRGNSRAVLLLSCESGFCPAEFGSKISIRDPKDYV